MGLDQRLGKGQKAVQAGTGARRDDIGAEPVQALDTGMVDDGAGLGQAVGFAKEGALALVAFHQVDPRAAQDGKDETGKPGAAAQIDQGSGGGRKVGVELRRVEDVTAPRIGQAGPADQIDAPLPTNQKVDQDLETLDGGGRKSMLVAQRPGRQRRLFHVKPRPPDQAPGWEWRCSARRTWASRTLNEAGVTPEMRAAAPRVAGRARSSLLRTSLDRPSTAR